MNELRSLEMSVQSPRRNIGQLFHVGGLKGDVQHNPAKSSVACRTLPYCSARHGMRRASSCGELAEDVAVSLCTFLPLSALAAA